MKVGRGRGGFPLEYHLDSWYVHPKNRVCSKITNATQYKSTPFLLFLFSLGSEGTFFTVCRFCTQNLKYPLKNCTIQCK